MYSEALEDLINLHRGGMSKTGCMGCVSKEDVERWAAVAKVDVSDAFDIVAMGIVHDYLSGIFTWEFCDTVANNLFGVFNEFWTADNNFVIPQKFWDFYIAFDDSEDAPINDIIDEQAKIGIAMNQAAMKNIAEFLAKHASS